MKKTYIAPLMEAETLETEQMLAASVLDDTSNTPSVTLTDEEYNDEFGVKGEGSYWE